MAESSQGYSRDIPSPYAKLRDGHDVVYGIKHRDDDSAVCKLRFGPFPRKTRLAEPVAGP